MMQQWQIDLFEERIMPVPESGCWVWMGTIDKCGYGRFSIKAQGQYTHRLSWTTFRGPIPSGLHVLHKCDIRCCVNPDHLFVGTQAENMRDMTSKGRHGYTGSRGENHPMVKLSAEQVAEIQATPPYTRGLDKKYNIAKSHVSRIRNGGAWGHLSLHENQEVQQ